MRLPIRNLKSRTVRWSWEARPYTASECRVLYTGENYQDAVYEATLEILNPNTSSQELGMVARYMSSGLTFSSPMRPGARAPVRHMRSRGAWAQATSA